MIYLNKCTDPLEVGWDRKWRLSPTMLVLAPWNPYSNRTQYSPATGYAHHASKTAKDEYWEGVDECQQPNFSKWKTNKQQTIREKHLDFLHLKFIKWTKISAKTYSPLFTWRREEERCNSNGGNTGSVTLFLLSSPHHQNVL